MPGGGGDVVVVKPPAAQATRGRRHRQQRASLPFDVLLEIAARTDPATFIRCAATCRDMRRRVPPRLQRTDRFVLPFLIGHLAGLGSHLDILNGRDDRFLVDTSTAADGSTRLTKVKWGFASSSASTAGPPETASPRGGGEPLDSSEGLLLARTAQDELMMCNPATGRRQTLPPAPSFGVQYAYQEPRRHVLLVGDGVADDGSIAVVGRPFKVVKAKLVLSKHQRAARCLIVQTFSSEHGAWGSRLPRRDPDPEPRRRRTLPARHTSPGAGGSPCVLVAGKEKIWAWVQSTHTKLWRQQPQVVIDNEAVARFVDGAGGFVEDKSSGAVLMQAGNARRRCLVWLDLQSKRIVWCFSSSCLAVKRKILLQSDRLSHFQIV
ncbi:hypothetical protein BS78_02G380500 [Paspalum vaginatum]|nr:hypothetical protein BS78_02G380500 [Paspalum vaginatum]